MMKLKYLVLLLALTFVGYSCGSDEPDPKPGPGTVDPPGPVNPPVDPGPEEIPFTFVGTIDNPEIPGEETRLISQNGGLVVRWSAGDKIVGQVVTGQTHSTPAGRSAVFTIDESSIRQEGDRASFNGELEVTSNYLFFYPSTVNAVINDSGNGFVLTAPAEQTQKGRDLSHVLDHEILIPTNSITGDRDNPVTFANFTRLLGYLEIPLGIQTADAADPIYVTDITLFSTPDDEGDVAPSLYVSYIYSYNRESSSATKYSVNASNPIESVKLNVEDAPALSDDSENPFVVRFILGAQAFNNVSIRINTNKGSYTTTVNSVSLNRGDVATIDYLRDIDPDLFVADGIISSASEWDASILAANEAGEEAMIKLMSNVTISTDNVMPTVPIFLTGDYALTVERGAGASLASQKKNRAVRLSSVDNKTFNFSEKLSLGKASLFANSVTVNAPSIEFRNGGKLDGNNAIFEIEELIVLNGEATLGQNATVRAEKVTLKEGSLDAQGVMYCDEIDQQGSAQVTGNEPTLRDDESLQIPNSGFEDWHQVASKVAIIYNGKAWVPSPEGGKAYWANGNYPTSAVYQVNPTTPEETHVYAGNRSAKIQSGFYKSTFASKFVAGNLFTGTFDGVSGKNGTMTFGIAYAHRPVALTGYYDYIGGLVNYDNDKVVSSPVDEDEWNIYIALSSKQYKVNTGTPSSYPDLENDKEIVAYGQYYSSETTNGYRQFRVDLEYKETTEVPKYLLIVATSSKNGGKFRGSTESVLYLDDIQLEF